MVYNVVFLSVNHAATDGQNKPAIFKLYNLMMELMLLIRGLVSTHANQSHQSGH